MYKNRYDILDILKLYTKGYNKQYYLREISKLTKIPLKTTQNLLAELENQKILKSKISGKNKYFQLNLDNIQTKLLLLKTEIKKTNQFLNQHSLLKTFLKEIHTNELIIVFGSFAKEIQKKESDLDLLIIKKQKLPLHLIPYKYHKIELTENDYTEAIKKQETLIKEIEENHIILNNHSDYINQMWRHYYEK